MNTPAFAELTLQPQEANVNLWGMPEDDKHGAKEQGKTVNGRKQPPH